MSQKKKLIMHVVGNRPQFIKLAPLSKEIRKRGYQDIIVHTGQHYDANMSDIFFEELGIHKPEVNLQIGSGTHAEMTAKCMVGLEKVFMEYSPTAVVVYGDTDSTLAAGITAAKMEIPICHVEAGPRTFKKNNPEEQNRIMVDHLSSLLFAPDCKSYDNLKRECVTGEVFQTGDIMQDSFMNSQSTDVLKTMGLKPRAYVLMTWHRQENTSSKERMESILDMVEQVPHDVICPLHPRTRGKLKEFGLLEKMEQLTNFKVIEPVGYFTMVGLMSHCKYLVTDSGGASKESCFAGVRCMFIVDLDVWTDLVDAGWILKVNVEDGNQVEEAISEMEKECSTEQLENLRKVYGTGQTSQMIVDILEEHQLV